MLSILESTSGIDSIGQQKNHLLIKISDQHPLFSLTTDPSFIDSEISLSFNSFSNPNFLSPPLQTPHRGILLIDSGVA